jgi:hypothetical protein
MLKPVDTANSDLVIDLASDRSRYRIAKTSDGYLITARTRDVIGLNITARWLHKTEEAALACGAVVMAGDAAFEAMGTPEFDTAMVAYGKAIEEHNAACERLGDKPLVGREIDEPGD